MTERGRAGLSRSARSLRIGPSSYEWTGTELVIELDERGGLPSLGRTRGAVTITPTAVTRVELPLTPDGAHVWRPFAPTARARVDLGPGWRWEGHAYLDANFGARPLEADFAYWTWARYPDGDGTLCLYDADRRDGTRLEAALRFGPGGRGEAVEAPPRAPLARSGWRIRRETRADPGSEPREVRAMLDAPFYTRAEVETVIGGRTVRGVHEALDLDRFDRQVVKAMLAFRIPRVRR